MKRKSIKGNYCCQRNFIKNLEVSFYLEQFCSSAQVKRRCSAYDISPDILKRASNEFQQLVLNDQINGLKLNDLVVHLQESAHGDNLSNFFMPKFLHHIKSNYPHASKKLNDVLDRFSLKKPAEWFPETRKMKRRIFLHLGPTNSGKTFNALKRFETAQSSIYLGPLRMLAHEVYEKTNEKGTACNLITGEERKESTNVSKWSCTIEMAHLKREFDVAVIDEIQMIGNRERGWAWTQALLGIQAKEVHICGEESSLELIKTLLNTTGDEIADIQHYKRLSPLVILNQSVNEFSHIQPGDCIISFSRMNIYGLKKAVERKTKYKAAVIYGALPPESRAEQARLFNEQTNGYSVLIASDAIGMGLNLNIKRIIFESITKNDGIRKRHLTASEMKQIAGRAGRFNSMYSQGQVTTLDKRDLRFLHHQMKTGIPKLLSAGLLPTLEQIERLRSYLPKDTFGTLLSRFEDLKSFEGIYFLSSLDDQRTKADMIEGIELKLEDRYIFVLSPFKIKNEMACQHFEQFASMHSKGKVMSIAHLKLPEIQEPITHTTVSLLEQFHDTVMLHCWLAIRFPQTMPHLLQLQELKRNCELIINRCLLNLQYSKRKNFDHFTVDQDDALEELTPLVIEGGKKVPT